jgi:nicotinamide-nucleotide amidase
MKAEVIAIGSELLLGQIVDTNTSYIAQTLAENGIELVRSSAVGDDQGRIEETMQRALGNASIVITTGGLGPTEDDLTRESIAGVTRRPLVFRRDLMDQIEAIFRRRGFHMVESNRKQAFIPEGAIPIENPKGTAPGFIVDEPEHVILSIPGVPSEMRYLMEHAVIPYLRKRFHLEDQIIQYKVLRTCGLGESAIGIQIEDLMRGQNPSVGTLASVGDIRIRITARSQSPEEASRQIRNVEQEIRKRLGPLIYGEDKETLQGNLMRQLERLNLTLSVAEVFTGGLLSQKLSDTGSPSFVQGLVLSSEISQRKFLGMDPEAYKATRSNTKALAEALARRTRDQTGTDLGLATVAQIVEEQGEGQYRIEAHFFLETPEGTETEEYRIGGEPLMVRERTAITAIDMVRKYLLKKEN